jgi:hypothetical protein
MYLMEISSEHGKSVKLAQDRVQWHPSVLALFNLFYHPVIPAIYSGWNLDYKLGDLNSNS